MPDLANRPVTVVIPTFRCNPYIRRAVESILAQTHTRLTLVVANDGDRDPPWPALAAIDDPRLVRFDLPTRRGPFFAVAVGLAATDDPYLLIQDADDWSEPNRLALLLHHLDERQADGAVSAVYRYTAAGAGRAEVTIERRGAQLGEPPALPDRMRHLIHHCGLFRTDALRALGGYFGGFEMGFDTLITNLLLMSGKVVYVNTPLYHRCLRDESLTIAPATGHGSPRRNETNQRMRALYAEAFADYSAFREGRMAREELLERLRRIAGRYVTPQQTEALAQESHRLRALLTAQRNRDLQRAPDVVATRPHAAAPPETLGAGLPLVSCIMPACDRRFVAQAIAYFLRQSYPHHELIVVDDGEPVADRIPADPRVRYVYLDRRLTLGEKRNLACDLARGTIIAHWDDGWQASWRLRYQVALLEHQHAELTGAARRYYYRPATAQAWLYMRPGIVRRRLGGGTLCYRKTLWERQPFAAVSRGENARFLWATRRAATAVAPDCAFYVALVHDASSGPRGLDGAFWRPRPVESVLRLLGDDAHFYAEACLCRT